MAAFYKIISFKDNQAVSESILFDSKDKALKYKEDIGSNKNLNHRIFKCIDESEKQKKVSFSDMTLYKYVNGYLLKPFKDSVYYGMEKI